jgi:hypothetical protein
MDHGPFWRAWRRLRGRQADPNDLDLDYVLSCAEDLWRERHALREKASAYDAMRAAYKAAKGSTKERQAAACRAGGLTRTDGPGYRSEPAVVLDRWYALTREHDRDRALEVLARELRTDSATLARRLRRYRETLHDLIANGAAHDVILRTHLDALTEGPAKAPSDR